MEQVFAARPNAAHHALALLESRFEGDFTLITQNVDGLHLAAGSREVVELHGSLRRRRCKDPSCSSEPFEELTIPLALPCCELCGNPLRPDIVLFGEQIPLGPSHQAKRSLRSVDLFLSVGTSGTVRPAANFVSGAKFSGALTVEINLESSGLFEREFLGAAENILPRLVGLGEPEHSLILLGKDESRYGQYTSKTLQSCHAYLSVGSDRNSPSLGFKGDKSRPNEDGLLVRVEGARFLLALADGHFGNEASHALLERLYWHSFPESPMELALALEQIQSPELPARAGTTFLACVVDIEGNRGFGFSTGDSTLGLIEGGVFRSLTEANSKFFYFAKPLAVSEWQSFEFSLLELDALLLYSDGVNECHYRHPETSLQPSQVSALWELFGEQPEQFGAKLMEAALIGLLGQPGGQDNIALIVLPLGRVLT